MTIHTLTSSISAIILFTCGTANAYTLKNTSKGRHIRWAQNVISMRIDPALDSVLDIKSMTASAVMASEAWRGYPNVPDLIINKGNPKKAGYDESDYPTNGIYLQDPWPYEPEKLAVTVTTFEESTGRLLDADILVNPEAMFELLTEDKKVDTRYYDFASILTHEFGHVLGMGHSFEDPMATMWAQIAKGETHKRTLTNDDESGIIVAYSGSPPEEAMGCGQASISRNRTQLPMVLVMIFTMTFLWLIYRTRIYRKWTHSTVIACGSIFCLMTSTSEHSIDDQLVQRNPMVPAAHISAMHPDAIKRMAKLSKNTNRLLLGKAILKATSQKDGLFWSTYRVTEQYGEEVEVRIPGGTINGITQQVGDFSPPTSGQQLVVNPDSDGPSPWAHYRDGAVFGGSLEDGPAIDYNL